MSRTRVFITLIAGALLLFFEASAGRSAEIATPDDTARFLAGLPPSAGSSLTSLTQNQGWQQHARAFNYSFGKIETGQLSKIRAWSRGHLATPKPVLFYMFSGPDFLYANAFFPKASTYVLSGLEPVGQIPDVFKLTPAATTKALNGLRNSLRSVLSTSFFITSHMGHDLHSSRLTGTLPVLYVFLARTGHTIQDVTLVSLDERGEVTTTEAPDGKKPTRGARITFSGNDGQPRTLYYFSTDLADERFAGGAFSQFCERLKEGDSFIKSASYLLHWNNFSQVRRFLLDHSAAIVQDDTGIPVGLYDINKWQVQPFGNYVVPIPIFHGMYQPKMRALFKTGNPSPIDFGVGYRWRPSQSSLLVARKRDAAPVGSLLNQSQN